MPEIGYIVTLRYAHLLSLDCIPLSQGANILLTDIGEVKIADFGVAAKLSTSVIKRSTVIGTPYWLVCSPFDLFTALLLLCVCYLDFCVTHIWLCHVPLNLHAILPTLAALL